MTKTTASLPLFEKQRVNTARLKVNGIAGNPGRALNIGERVSLVVEAEIYAVEHTESKDGIERLHKAFITDYGEMDRMEAQQLLAGLEEQRRAAFEQENGIVPMFGGADRAANDADDK